MIDNPSNLHDLWLGMGLGAAAMFLVWVGILWVIKSIVTSRAAAFLAGGALVDRLSRH